MADSIEALYGEAYALVEQGICYDEVGQTDGALAMYERGLELIDRAGQLPGAADSPLFAKMRNARDHILYRLKDLRSGLDSGLPPPPSMESPPRDPFEAIQGTIHAFGDAKSAEELFIILGGCQLFYIQADDTTVPSYPAPLRIFRFRDDSPATETPPSSTATPPAFLQVGDWVHPLVPGQTPVLSTDYGAYVFPHPTSDAPDLHVGLILPNDLEPGVRGNLEQLLGELAATPVRQSSVESALSQEERDSLGAKIARLLVHGGQAVAWGVKKGQELTSGFVRSETDKALERSAKTSNPRPVDPRVQTSIHYLRKGSKIGVKVSGYLVNKVGQIATYIGSSIAETATKRVSADSAKGGSLLAETIEVAKGGVAAFGTVYMGMENAAKQLARDIANDTCRYVDHRYGEDMARVTMDGMKAVGHGGMTAWNVTELGPKAIAKRTAKKAGLAVLSDLGGGEKSPKGVEDSRPPRPPPPAPSS